MHGKEIIMRDPKFKVDDEVCEKSGNIKMTVDEVVMRGNIFTGKYRCYWFKKTRKYSKVFLEIGLILWDEKPDASDYLIAFHNP